MKELSIEEKAKAYDGNYKAYTELINRLEDVKEAIKKHNYGIAMDILYKPYPEFQITTSTELRESEDERIKKMLRDVISQWRTGNQAWCSDVKLIDATLAWLEKQGEQKPVEWSEDLVKEALLSEVLPCFMHGGEADEVVAMLGKKLNKR